MKLILAAALLICVLTNATEEPSSNSANPEDPWEELSHETALTKKPVVRRTQQWSKNKVEEDLVQDGYGRRVRKRIEKHRASTAPRREQRKERFAKFRASAKEKIMKKMKEEALKAKDSLKEEALKQAGNYKGSHEGLVKKSRALATADPADREKMMGALKEEAMSDMKKEALKRASSHKGSHEAAVKKASALAAADAYHREKMMGAMKEEAMSHMKARAVRAASSYRATHHDRRRSKSHTNRLEEELVQGEWGERDA